MEKAAGTTVSKYNLILFTPILSCFSLQYCLACNRGGAYGFNLTTLTKLMETKSQDKDSKGFTLIDVIAEEFHHGDGMCRESLRMVEEWECVKTAQKVDLAQCDSDLGGIEATMRRIKKELEQPEVTEDDKFRVGR